MLTKKRLPERFEIFCCCICLFTAYFSASFSVFLCKFLCANIILCVGKFTSGWVERERQGGSERIYIYYTSFCSRKSSETPKKKTVRCIFLFVIAFKKSFSFSFCCALEERDILWQQLVIFIFVNIHIMSWLFCAYNLLFEMPQNSFFLLCCEKWQRW